MPLSPLHNIQVTDLFWQGWESYLKNIPFLSSQEGVVAKWLNTHKPTSFHKTFVAQSDLPPNVAYETYIYHHHRIPTRDGLHDFFNGLCWFLFPKIKLNFNQIHQQQIEQKGIQHRGKIRDALTILDENGFLIACPDLLWQALVAKEWYKAFVDYRSLWQQTKVMVFGHALLEKLVFPYKAMTAHALRVPYSLLDKTTIIAPDCTAPQCFSSIEIKRIDEYLAEWLKEETLATKPYIPLQIFGIPHWSNEKQTTEFYQDTTVFRLPRTKRSVIQD